MRFARQENFNGPASQNGNFSGSHFYAGMNSSMMPQGVPTGRFQNQTMMTVPRQNEMFYPRHNGHGEIVSAITIILIWTLLIFTIFALAKWVFQGGRNTQAEKSAHTPPTPAPVAPTQNNN